MSRPLWLLSSPGTMSTCSPFPGEAVWAEATLVQGLARTLQGVCAVGG